MANVTVLKSSSEPAFVTFIVNTPAVFERLARCFPDTFVQTTSEAQTIDGFNFRQFENLMWRNSISVYDGRM